jgi:hypothetical protein
MGVYKSMQMEVCRQALKHPIFNQIEFFFNFYSPQGVRQITTIMNVRRRCLPAGDSAQQGFAINFEDDF